MCESTTTLIVLDAGHKVSEAHYRNVMLLQQFLPVIRQISSEFTFQQDSALAHTALQAINFIAHNFARY